MTMKQSLTPPERLLSLSHTQSRCQITALKWKQTCVFSFFLHLAFFLSHSLAHSLSLAAAAVFLFVRQCVWVIFAPFFALLNCAFIYSSLYLLLPLSPCFSLLNVLTSNVWHFSRTLDPRASFELFGEIFFLLCRVFYFKSIMKRLKLLNNFWETLKKRKTLFNYGFPMHPRARKRSNFCLSVSRKVSWSFSSCLQTCAFIYGY